MESVALDHFNKKRCLHATATGPSHSCAGPDGAVLSPQMPHTLVICTAQIRARRIVGGAHARIAAIDSRRTVEASLPPGAGGVADLLRRVPGLRFLRPRWVPLPRQRQPGRA